MGQDDQKFDRRIFLGGGLVAGATALVPAPVERLLDLMTKSFIHQAQADTNGTAGSRNYINLLLAGAPHRYAFDHWIRTNPSDPAMNFNPMVATALVNSGGRAVGTQYLTFNYKNLLVPQMFSHSVYNGKGQLRPLTNLLDNMMVIRGYGTGMDGHPFNATNQMAPLGGASSISGTAADYSTKTFQAIQWPARGQYGNYNSTTGKAMNTLGTMLPVNNLLQGFGPAGADRLKATNLIHREQAAIDLARSRLQAYIKSGQPGATILAQNMTNATALMKKGVGDISSYWNEALPRYQNLIQNSMRMTGLSGLSDMALVSDGSLAWKIHVADGSRPLMPQGDLRNYLGTRTIPTYLAEGFALAEYVIKQALATSVELYTDNFGNMILNEGAGDVAHNIIHDMHETGAITGTILTSSYYRGISAAILELADQLKATAANGTNMWSETVLQITSDFGRVARLDGSGSDHGFNQMVTSVYSGIIKSPMVIGNIYQEGNNGGYGAGYAGTQGVGAPIAGYNQNGRPNAVMAASTVTGLLRVDKNPFQNLAAPLVTETNGQAVASMAGKIVA